MSPQLEALAMLNKLFASRDGAPVDQATITRAQYGQLFEALIAPRAEVVTTGTAGQPATEYVLVPPRWIDTKTRVPADGDDVLGYWQGNKGGKPDISVVHYYRGMWHDPANDEDDYGAPDFWMPLPSGPLERPEKP